MKNCIFLILSLIGLINKSTAQFGIDGVSYQLKYNADSCWYDVYLIINAGSATTVAERVQFNSQLSLIVPTGTNVTIPRGYMPLINNSTSGTGSHAPGYWALSSAVYSPAVAPGKDFRAITPSLSAGTAYYNKLNQGDTVKLFSIRLTPMVICSKDVRLYINGVDPTSADPGMGGANFSNEFTIQAAANQIYDNNAAQVYPKDSIIQHNPIVVFNANELSIDVTTSTTSCQSPLTYAWTGPLSYSSIAEDVYISPVSSNNNGTYKLVVRDALGCKDSIEIMTSNKPQAGPDQMTCAGSSINVSGSSPTTGNWSALPTNPPGFTINLGGNGNATIAFSNTSTGVYMFKYSTTLGDDTMKVTVNPRPITTLTGPNLICIGGTTSFIPSSGGTWNSADATIASITNGGLVTGILSGTTILIFTENSTSCVSNPSTPITVQAKPTVGGVPATPRCIGTTLTLTFSPAGGTWVSNNIAVATVVAATGVVTTVGPGTVNFTYTTGTGCSNTTSNLVVSPKPTVSSSLNDICVGSLATLSPNPSLGTGTWISLTPTIMSSSGATITGVSAGIGKLLYQETATTCFSDTLKITVNPRPIITLTGNDSICGGANTSFTPSTGGSWATVNGGIATINNSGLVTGIFPGVTFCTFTNTSTGCISEPSVSITVLSSPIISLTGPSEISINQTTSFAANTTGTWLSLNPSIATINPISGLVTGVSKGTASFQFTSIYGCESNILDIDVIGTAYQITGFCFTDINGNGIFDNTVDFPLPNVNINIEGDSITYYTNVNGYFNIPVDSGMIKMYNTINFGNWVNDTIIRNLNIKNPQSYVFIGFVPSSTAGNASGLAGASSSTAPCKTFANLYAQAFNASSKLIDGYLILEFEPRTYVSTSLPLPSGGQDNYLVWTFSDLPPGRTFSPNIEYYVPDALSNNDSLHFTVSMVELSTGDTLSAFTLAQPIICNGTVSLDRARTWPDRTGEDNYTLIGEGISYNIVFANKGTGSATSATIKCAIDKNLNLGSLKIQKASHNFEVFSLDGTLVFYADSLTLEASNRDGNSEVYVNFTLSPNSNIADKTVLYMNAEVSMDNGYIDRSNTVINTIVNILPCDLINDEISQVGNKLIVTNAGTSYKWYDCLTGINVSALDTLILSANGNYYCIIEGPSCKSQTDCFDFIFTGTSDDLENQINIFPNPVNDILHINIDESNFTINVEDMTGRLLLQTKDKAISFANRSSGIYLIKIKIGSREIIKKVVKF